MKVSEATLNFVMWCITPGSHERQNWSRWVVFLFGVFLTLTLAKIVLLIISPPYD